MPDAALGLQAVYKGPNTSKKLPLHPITQKNHVWCRDITYIPLRSGFLYLVTVMDWAERNEAYFCETPMKQAT